MPEATEKFRTEKALGLLQRGRKIRKVASPANNYLHLVDGTIVDQAGAPATITNVEYEIYTSNTPSRLKQTFWINVHENGTLQMFTDEAQAVNFATDRCIAIGIKVKINIDIDESTRRPVTQEP